MCQVVESHLGRDVFIAEGRPFLAQMMLTVPSQSGSQFLNSFLTDLSGQHYDPKPYWQIVL